jgi:hypothetical protein
MALFSFTSPIALPDDEQQVHQTHAPTPFWSRFNNAPDNDIEDVEEQLSRWDRLILFAISMACSLSCYIVSFMLLPVLTLKPRKFALLWSLGSLLFLFSFGILQGFTRYFKHLFSVERIWFTGSFALSILFSIIASMVLKSTLLAIISCVIQFISMIWYTVSYFPMGRQGLRLASTVAVSQVDTWLNA